MIRYAIYYCLCFLSILTNGYTLDNQEALDKICLKMMADQKQTICLNMIVKDESKVIKRGLATVKPIINYWVIVDTGSTDGTQQIIKDFMKDIPGELHERPWKNFEHNRNQALELAKGKANYILFMDADETLEFSPDFKLPVLHKDTYNSVILDAGSKYDRTLLIKDGLDWQWHGVLHEYISASQAKNAARLEGVTKISNREGSRSNDPQKYLKDAKVLEEALKEDPNNSRYVFYLAQSYRDAQDFPSALKNYEKRISMGGWDQEVFYAKLEFAKLQQILNKEPETILKGYYDAYHYRPSRAEPLYYLAKYYRNKNDFAAAYLIASIGSNLPLPDDILFVDKWIYDYDMLLELSISAYWIGKYEECQKMSKQLLANSELPQYVRDVVEKNLSFAEAKLVAHSPDN